MATGSNATLADLLLDQPAKPLVVFRVLSQVLEALAALHATNACHAPLSPSAIRLDRTSGQPSIAGLSRPLDSGDTVAFQFTKYSAPDAFLDSGVSACESIDCYVLGFMFYEVLIGRHAFGRQFATLENGPPALWLRWHADRNLKAAPLDDLRPQLAHFADLIEGMIEKDPSKRIGTFSEALASFSSSDQTTFAGVTANRKRPLAALAAAEDDTHFPSSGKSLAPSSPITIAGVRKSWLAAGVIALALAIAAVSVWFVRFQGRSEPQVAAAPETAPPGDSAPPLTPVLPPELPPLLENAPEIKPALPPPAPRLRIESRLNGPAAVSLDAENARKLSPEKVFERELLPGVHTLTATSWDDKRAMSLRFSLSEDGRFTVTSTQDGSTLHAAVVDPIHEGNSAAASPSNLEIVLEPARMNARVPVEIFANVNNGVVFVDGEKLPRTLSHGSAVYQFAPGSHRVKVAGPGYQDSSEQRLEVIADSQHTPLKFVLSPLVADGDNAAPSPPSAKNNAREAEADIITDLPGKAQLLVDGVAFGSADASGTLTAKLEPGMHKLTLRVPGSEDSTISREFPAGGTVKLGLDEFRGLGEITFHISPANAQIFLRHEDLEPKVCPNNQPCKLPAGEYILELKANGFGGVKKAITIAAGANNPYPEELMAAESGPKPRDLFENGASWDIEPDGSWSHAASDDSFIRPKQGTYTFDVQKPSGVFGSKKIVLVVHHRRDKSQATYTFDEHGVQSSERGPGINTENPTQPAPELSEHKYFRLKIAIQPDSIVISYRDAKTGEMTSLNQPGDGKVGFSGKVNLKVAQ